MRMHRGGTFHIFAEQELRMLLEARERQAREEVRGQQAQYVLNVNEVEYTQYLVSRYSVDKLQIHFERLHVSSREERIPAERFPVSGFFVRPGESYPKQVITYHMPFEGDENLLRYVPNPRVLSSEEVWIEDGSICFDIIDLYSDPERIKSRAQQVINLVQSQFGYLEKNVADFNSSLPDRFASLVSQRKDELKKQLGVVTSLGVPIKPAESVPSTFRIPDVRRKVTVSLQPPTVGVAQSEPTIGDDVYQAILQVIHDTGKVFERLPSTYAGKEEEDLRDFLILQLTPHFEGSTTGETFNKGGKTDVLIRHENKNAFIAECKFWRGRKAHLETIDQLLSYLTWRDSKTAIVLFVNRKDFSAALNESVAATKEHPNFVRYVGSKEESWHNFELHLLGDMGRLVKLALLAFHLPR